MVLHAKSYIMFGPILFFPKKNIFHLQFVLLEHHYVQLGNKGLDLIMKRGDFGILICPFPFKENNCTFIMKFD